MGNREDSIILKKSFDFALKIIELNKLLNSKKEFVLSNQVLRSGASIGANVHEALGGVSTKDFQFKLAIALKEANETEYWLKLLQASNIVETNELIINSKELQKILSAILITSRKNAKK